MAKSIRKRIEVDVNETLDAEVSLNFYEMKQFFEECNNEEKAEICHELGIRTYATYAGDTVLDQIKNELLLEAAKKYSLEELEQRLK